MHAPLAAAARHPRTPGILYAEDFEAEPVIAAAPAAPLPCFTENQLRAAHAEGHQAGLAEGAALARVEHAALAAELRLATLHAIADRLNVASAEWARLADRNGRALAATVLAALAAALPTLCARHADLELAAVLRAVLPGLATEPRATLRVHPASADAMTADLATLSSPCPIATEPDPNLAPGDIRIAWQHGAATRDTRAILAAIGHALAPLTLLPIPPEEPADGDPA